MQQAALANEDRYFMTPEDQDAVIGRLVREKKAAETKRATLEAEAHRIAADMRELALHLEKRLPGIQIQGQALPAEFLPFETWLAPGALQQPQRILALANEYRETITNLRRISDQLKRAGID